MGFLCERRIDGKDGTGGHRQQLEYGGALDKNCEDRRFLNRFAGRKLAMVGVSLPEELENMLSMVKPTLAGG